MILSTRYISSINQGCIALGTKSRLLDPTFSSSSELLLIKDDRFIRQSTNSRFNDILLDGKFLICAKENEFSVYEILDEKFSQISKDISEINNLIEENDSNEEIDFSQENDQERKDKISPALKLLTAYKITVTSVQRTPKPTMFLLAANKLIFFDVMTLKLYNIGTNIENIRSISYNKKVNHIISIISNNSLIIFDLKKKESVITKQFNNLFMAEWIPEHSTKMIILNDKKLRHLDLSSDKLQTVSENTNGFTILPEDGQFALFAWNDQALMKYTLPGLLQTQRRDIPDIFHYNQSDTGRSLPSGMAGQSVSKSVPGQSKERAPSESEVTQSVNQSVPSSVPNQSVSKSAPVLTQIVVLSQTSSGTTVSLGNVRGHGLLHRSNTILSQNRKFRIRPRLLEIAEKEQDTVQDRKYELSAADESVKMILRGDVPETLCETLPINYLVTREKELLLSNRNFLSILLVCKKQNDWKYLIEKGILDYREILRALEKDPQQINDLIPSIIDNNHLNDQEIIDLYVLVGENDRSWCMKLKRELFREYPTNSLAAHTRRFNRMMMVLEQAENNKQDLNSLGLALVQTIPEKRHVLEWFMKWAHFHTKTRIVQGMLSGLDGKGGMRVNTRDYENTSREYNTLRPREHSGNTSNIREYNTSGHREHSGINLREGAAIKPNTFSGVKPSIKPDTFSGVKPSIRPDTISRIRPDTISRIKPIIPGPANPRPIIPGTGNSIGPTVQSNGSPTGPKTGIRPMGSTPVPNRPDLFPRPTSQTRVGGQPGVSPPLRPEPSGSFSRLNVSRPSSYADIMNRTSQSLSVDPLGQLDRLDRRDQSQRPVSAIPSILRKPEVALPDRTTSPRQGERPASPGPGLVPNSIRKSPGPMAKPTHQTQDRRGSVPDAEKTRINRCMSDLIIFVKQESAKRRSIVYKSRIKDGLIRLQAHHAIQSETDFQLLRNLSENVEENLRIVERVHGALTECKPWVDGIVILWKIIKQ